MISSGSCMSDASSRKRSYDKIGAAFDSTPCSAYSTTPLKCPFCREMVREDLLRCHIYGGGDGDLVGKCRKVREIYPQGILPEVYVTLRRTLKIERKLSMSDTKIQENYSKTPSQPSSSKFRRYNFRSKNEAENPVPKSRRSIAFTPSSAEKKTTPSGTREVAQCDACKQEHITSSMLYLPCCHRQRTCLWCIVGAGNEHVSSPQAPTLKCSGCKMAIVLPAHNSPRKMAFSKNNIAAKRARFD